MRKIISILIICVLLFSVAGCGGSKSLPGYYVYEGEGAGGSFTITLEKSGAFQYYEGPYSSYIGEGKYSLMGEEVLLTVEDEDGSSKYYFIVQDGVLVFEKNKSDSFMYVKLDDGARFVKSAD